MEPEEGDGRYIERPLERWERELLAEVRWVRDHARHSRLTLEFQRDGSWHIYRSVPVTVHTHEH